MRTSKDVSLLYLWNLRTLYIGQLFEGSSIIQAASSLVVGIESDIELRLKGRKEPIITRVALLPAGVEFGAETGENKVVSLYLDPVGRDFALLRHIMKNCTGGIFHDSTQDDLLVDTFRLIYASTPPPSDTYRLLQEHVFPQPERFHFRHEVDPRIWQAINFMKMNALDNIGSEVLAEHVGMSDAQLRRVFKSTTGIPLRRYRRWHRLFITATLMASGRTLTDAALAAGFSDSSHFNHTFREMLGVKPSSILRRKDHIKIYVGQESAY